MKHTEQLQARPSGGKRSDIIHVPDESEERPRRKCCGGSDSGDSKN
jgi:hypothetical protein